MIVARHVHVTGRVQGVFFRAWTEEQAERLKVNGWVRNCPDGSVEAHLEGEEGAVNWLIDLIGDGPPSARVAKVQVREAEVEGATSSKFGASPLPRREGIKGGWLASRLNAGE